MKIDKDIKTKMRRMAKLSKELRELNLEVRLYLERSKLSKNEFDNIKMTLHEVVYEEPDLLSVKQFIKDVESGEYE
jgi:hypothetical protein